MKRSIICPSCNKKHPNLFASNDSRYPGEHIKNVEGEALFDMTCDFCGKPIGEGFPCTANSIWADHSPNPYYPWESEYISIREAL